MCFSMVNIRTNCNNILTAYSDARSLSFACRRLQFNKLPFYLYDNTPIDFTVVSRRQTYDQIDARTFDSPANRKKSIKATRIVAIHYVIH